MHDKHIVIIGNGIASKCVVYELNKIGFNSITVIANDDFAPSCSLSTTAINCLRGTKANQSSLGDTILKSFDDFVDFYNNEKPNGICKTLETHCTPLDTKDFDKWNRRYSHLGFNEKNSFDYFNKPLNKKFYTIDNEAYIFSPTVFYNWFSGILKSTCLNDTVVEINENTLKTLNGKELAFDELIICTSYMSKNFSSLVDDQKLKHKLMHSKPVPGSYLKFNIKDFHPEQLELLKTYCFRIDEIHLIVRPFESDVLLGATSTNNELSFVHNVKELKSQYDRMSNYLAGVIDFPIFEKADLKTGIRHKGQGRNPYWGSISTNKYAVWGLYKNAFTFSFTAAKEIARLIEK